MNKSLKRSSILITGGTGSFGNAFVPLTLKKYNPKRLVIFSRDEMKQWDMAQKFKDYATAEEPNKNPKVKIYQHL